MKPAGHFCLKTVLYNLIDRSNQALYARLLFCAQFLKKMRAASKQLSTAVGQAVERADGEAYLVDDEFYISVYPSGAWLIAASTAYIQKTSQHI